MEDKLDSSWENINEIIPFGYGRIGRRVIGKLSSQFNIPFIIDNNPNWWNKKKPYQIYALEKVEKKIDGRKIVVTTTDLQYLSIKRELESRGFVEDRDFCLLSHFLGEWYMKYKGLLCISKIDTIITSRCTLPCKHCAMYIHDCKHQVDYSLQELCRNFDTVFKVIDYVMEYSLFGGEPLIYVELDKLIGYLMDNYGEKIGRLVLITNGNVKPSEMVYNCLQKYNVMVSISDYNHKYNYLKTRDVFIQNLENKGIEYSFNDELVWKDVGYPDNPANIPSQNALEHFRKCGHSTFCINNGILYFCDAMFGAEVNTDYNTQEDDVVNLQECLDRYGLDYTKRRILQYIEGEINETGYPSFCQLCRGVGEDNDMIIEAGS